MGTIEILNSLPPDFVGVLASLLVVAVVGKVTGAELRLVLLAVVGVVLFPDPAVVYGVAILGLVLRVLDFLNLARSGGEV